MTHLLTLYVTDAVKGAKYARAKVAARPTKVDYLTFDKGQIDYYDY